MIDFGKVAFWQYCFNHSGVTREQANAMAFSMPVEVLLEDEPSDKQQEIFEEAKKGTKFTMMPKGKRS